MVCQRALRRMLLASLSLSLARATCGPGAAFAPAAGVRALPRAELPAPPAAARRRWTGAEWRVRALRGTGSESGDAPGEDLRRSYWRERAAREELLLPGRGRDAGLWNAGASEPPTDYAAKDREFRLRNGMMRACVRACVRHACTSACVRAYTHARTVHSRSIRVCLRACVRVHLHKRNIPSAIQRTSVPM